MENTIENKKKLFAQYWGQDVAIQNEGGGSGFSYDINEATIADIRYDFLKLKPLSSITDEDAVEVAYLHWIDYRESKHKVDISWLKNVLETISQHSTVCEYLRSKGYALHWMGLSVEKMAEYGWIKLITND